MKLTTHGNNLIQLTYYGFVNVYLLRENDGFTLIDTALAGCARSIVQVAQQFGQPIVRILLTHAHADHSGGLDVVHALVPDAEFIMPARDARFLRGDMSLDAGEPQDKLRGGWVIRKAQPARLLHALEPNRMAVGHGRLLQQPLAAMDCAIKEATRKLGQPAKNQVASNKA